MENNPSNLHSFDDFKRFLKADLFSRYLCDQRIGGFPTRCAISIYVLLTYLITYNWAYLLIPPAPRHLHRHSCHSYLQWTQRLTFLTIHTCFLANWTHFRLVTVKRYQPRNYIQT